MSATRILIDTLVDAEAAIVRAKEQEKEIAQLQRRLSAAQKREAKLQAQVKRLERNVQVISPEDEEWLWGHRGVTIEMWSTPKSQGMERKIRIRFVGPGRKQINAKTFLGYPLLEQALDRVRTYRHEEEESAERDREEL